MAEPLMYYAVSYCNRCDRGFEALSSVSKAAAKAMADKALEEHVVKHPDYVPELHSEIDPE
jgi:hypothetical protein